MRLVLTSTLVLIGLLAPLRAQDEIPIVSSVEDVRALPEDTTAVHVDGLSAEGVQELARLKQLHRVELWMGFDSKEAEAQAAQLIAAIESLRELRTHGAFLSADALACFAEHSRLTSLEAEWASDLTDEGMEQIAAIETLKYLRIDFGIGITGVGYAHLSALTNLEELVLPRRYQNYRQVSGDALQPLATLTKLTKVDLSGWPLDESLFYVVGKWSQLAVLSLAGASGDFDDGLEAIGQLEQLVELDLSETTVSDWGLQHLAPLKNLEVLDLSGGDDTGNISDVGIEFLKGNERLRVLNLGERKGVTDRAMKLLAGFPMLEQLTVNSESVTPAGWKYLAGSGSLRVLVVDAGWGWSSRGGSYGTVRDDGLRTIASIQTLESLNIDRVAITDEAMRTLSKLTGLRTLTLGSSEPGWDEELPEFTGSGLSSLGESPLEELELKGFESFTDDGLEAGLKPLNQLKRLALRDCLNITGEFVDAFDGSSTLETLSLVGCHHIGDAALEALEESPPNLATLDIRDCREISDEGLAYLHARKSLKEIRMSAAYRIVEDTDTGETRRYPVQTKISDEGVQALKEALPDCNVVREPPDYTGWGGSLSPWPNEKEYKGPKDPDETVPPDDDDDEEQEDEF